MKKKNDVEVLIDGRKYTLCGFESPEYIQKIASYINRKLAELRNTLLAINIADDYYKEKKKASEYRTETQLKDKMVLDMKHEIIELQDTIKKLEKERDEFHDSVEKLEKKQVELETRLKQKR